MREALKPNGADSLPTNIAWFNPPLEALSRRLESLIVVVDIGARGLPPSELNPLAELLHVIAFDADAESARSSETRARGKFGKHETHNLFIGAATKKILFNHYKIPGCSSLLEPVESFAVRYLPDLKIESVEEVSSCNLDEFLRSEGLTPDLIKLDVQGTELEILESSQGALSQALVIMVEVEFVEEYVGQGLAHDVFRCLSQEGFELLHLNRVFLPRVNNHVLTRGQLVFGDALFMRPPESLKDAGPESVIKYALLAINFGHVDLACEALRIVENRFEWASEIRETIESNYRNTPSKLQAFFLRFLEVINKLSGALLSSASESAKSDRGRPTR